MEIKSLKPSFRFIALAGLLFSLVSCNTAERNEPQTPVPEISQTPAPISTNTTGPINTLIPTFTPSVEASATQGATLTSAPTIEPSNTKSPTALPTLTSDQAQALVLELMSEDPNCPLPCFWGFIPGETSWVDAAQFLESFATAIDENRIEPVNGYISMRAVFSVPGEVSSNAALVFVYSLVDDVIEIIEGKVGNLPDFQLAHFFNVYGPPGEIWVAPGREDIYSFNVWLFYPDAGILASYPMPVSVLETGALVCPSDPTDPYLAVWEPGKFEAFFDLFFISSVFSNPDELFLWHQIGDVSDISPSDFYDQFMQEGASDCFEIPRENWPDLPPP